MFTWLNTLASYPLTITTLRVSPTIARSVVVRVTDAKGASYDETMSLAVTDVAPETLTGGAGADTLRGGIGNDPITGNGGADTPIGGPGVTRASP